MKTVFLFRLGLPILHFGRWLVRGTLRLLSAHHMLGQWTGTSGDEQFGTLIYMTCKRIPPNAIFFHHAGWSINFESHSTCSVQDLSSTKFSSRSTIKLISTSTNWNNDQRPATLSTTFGCCQQTTILYHHAKLISVCRISRAFIVYG